MKIGVQANGPWDWAIGTDHASHQNVHEDDKIRMFMNIM